MKPSIPQGNRDFSSTQIIKRRYILDTIREVFELYGFEPLETPAMENLETLMGKYGEEGDKLIFKILNNGLDNPSKESSARAGFENILAGKNEKSITERALRYDLTIPFARHIAMNQGKLTLPFKRYQMQPVWRADRPQKGRYREFFQCDADVAGTFSPMSDVEFAFIYAAVFKKLHIHTVIKINNRKILAGLAEVCESADKMTAITVVIDKLDKIGLVKVKEELTAAGLNESQSTIIEKYLQIKGSNSEKIAQLEQILCTSQVGIQGVQELKFIFNFLTQENTDGNFEVDPTLARGLNYYTGTIYEVKALQVQIGSIGGGGRYDNLTGFFGVPNVPGVGISFGLDRIYDVMEEKDLFPENITATATALFLNLGETEIKTAFKVMQECRKKGISCEMVYEKSKLDKQFKYADKKGIKYAIIIGSDEILNENCVVKELKTGLQQKISQKELPHFLIHQ